MPQELPELLTSQQLADVFAVDPATVNRWARDGVIVGIRLPGMKGYRFRRDQVEQLLETTQAS